MNLTRLFLIAMLILAFGVGSNSQEPAKAVLIDSFGKPSCELLLNRLDYLASAASKTPGRVGFFVMYPGKNVLENIAYERAVKNNSAFRRFPDGLIRLIRAERKDELSFDMWTSSAEKPPAVRDVPFDYRLSNLSQRTLLVEDSVELFRFRGKLEYGSEGDGCLNEFNLDALSKLLLANPDLSAEIIIFNESAREAKKLIQLILDDAISESKLSRKRLRIIYGGRGNTKEWSFNISALEVWLLPTKIK